MKGFLSDLYLRPSCYDCPSKCGKSECDITLGDFWEIQKILPYYDDDKGVSAVLIYNPELLEKVKGILFENSHKVTYQEVFIEIHHWKNLHIHILIEIISFHCWKNIV